MFSDSLPKTENRTQNPLSRPEKQPALLPIGKAARQAGLSRQSVQYYLMLGLLEATETTPSGRRLFDRKAIERLRLIKQLNASGYTLRAIRELFLKQHKPLKGKNL